MGAAFARFLAPNPHDEHPRWRASFTAALNFKLAAVMVGAAMTNQFLLEESPWLPLALLVVAAVIAWARRSSNSILVDMLRR